MKARTLIPALLITFAASGCATWDNMSSREKSATTGAAVGGVAGAVVSNGGRIVRDGGNDDDWRSALEARIATTSAP